MIIVLDTNVLVAGLLDPFGPPGRILDLVLAGDVQLAYDDRILAEYRAVLARDKFGFDPTAVDAVLAYIETTGCPITAPPLNIEWPDPDDTPFLEVAQAAQVAALVTGNPRHYPTPSRLGVTVTTPAQFIEHWLSQ